MPNLHRSTPSPRATTLGVLAVSLLFSLVILLGARNSRAVDLQPSFVGCRVLAAGQPAHLFSHSPTYFSQVHDAVWDALAGGSAVDGRYTGPTYVQTPLWAWLLRPACTTLPWRTFRMAFLAITVFAVCGLVGLAARFWTPALFTPGRVALLLLAVGIGRPFYDVVVFAQTHAIFMLCTALAILLARKNHQFAAGVLLACAAAVKITPGFLLLYWLVARKWKAAGSFIASSLALVGLTVATTGVPLFREFLTNLSRTSNILLVAYNNQSLAAWWGGRHRSAELHQWLVHPLPHGLKLLSVLLMLASSLIGGWLDRSRAEDQPPFGAIFALLGATVFASISWDHYAFILIVPIMLLVQRYLAERELPVRNHPAHLTTPPMLLAQRYFTGRPATDRSLAGRGSLWLVLAAAIFLLNLDPGIGLGKHIVFPIVRSHFFAMLLSMAAMALCALTRQTNDIPSVEEQSAVRQEALLQQSV